MECDHRWIGYDQCFNMAWGANRSSWSQMQLWFIAIISVCCPRRSGRCCWFSCGCCGICMELSLPLAPPLSIEVLTFVHAMISRTMTTLDDYLHWIHPIGISEYNRISMHRKWNKIFKSIYNQWTFLLNMEKKSISVFGLNMEPIYFFRLLSNLNL